MSHRSQGRRAQRQSKDARKWAFVNPQTKEKPGGGASRRACVEQTIGVNLEPSRKGEGLAALRTLSE